MKFSNMEIMFLLENAVENKSHAQDLISDLSQFVSDCETYNQNYQEGNLYFLICAPFETMLQILTVMQTFDFNIIQTTAYADKDFN